MEKLVPFSLNLKRFLKEEVRKARTTFKNVIPEFLFFALVVSILDSSPNQPDVQLDIWGFFWKIGGLWILYILFVKDKLHKV